MYHLWYFLTFVDIDNLAFELKIVTRTPAVASCMQGTWIPHFNFHLSENFLRVRKLSSKNSKFGDENPAFWGKFRGKIFEHPQSALSQKFTAVRRRIATFVPTCTHDAATRSDTPAMGNIYAISLSLSVLQLGARMAQTDTRTDGRTDGQHA